MSPVEVWVIKSDSCKYLVISLAFVVVFCVGINMVDELSMSSELIWSCKENILLSEESYTEWKQDLQAWILFMNLPKEKQGPVVFWSLPQNIGVLDICQ